MCIYCYFERGDDILLRRDQNVEPAYANIELDRRGAEGRVDVKEKGGAARGRKLTRDDVRHIREGAWCAPHPKVSAPVAPVTPVFGRVLDTQASTHVHGGGVHQSQFPPGDYIIVHGHNT